MNYENLIESDESTITIVQSDLFDWAAGKRRMRDGLNNAIKSGRIDRPQRCRICGRLTTGGCIGHHYDYHAHSTDVTWCCERCHRVADALKQGRTVTVESTTEWT
jgi:hypothetical protein